MQRLQLYGQQTVIRPVRPCLDAKQITEALQRRVNLNDIHTVAFSSNPDANLSKHVVSCRNVVDKMGATCFPLYIVSIRYH